MFSQASVILSTWGVGHAWPAGVGGHMCGKGCVWQGACMAGGCMVGGVGPGGMHCGGVCGRGHAWRGGCMTGVHGGVCVARGRALRGGACVAWGMLGRRDGHCSGQYASYWNAFLSKILISSVKVVCSGV